MFKVTAPAFSASAKVAAFGPATGMRSCGSDLAHCTRQWRDRNAAACP